MGGGSVTEVGRSSRRSALRAPAPPPSGVSCWFSHVGHSGLAHLLYASSVTPRSGTVPSPDYGRHRLVLGALPALALHRWDVYPGVSPPSASASSYSLDPDSKWHRLCGQTFLPLP